MAPAPPPPDDPLTARTGLAREQRRTRAQIAAHTRWSRTTDRTAATAAARDAQLRKLENEVDPEHELPPELRAKLVENARRAHLIRMAHASAKAKTASARRAREASGSGDAR